MLRTSVPTGWWIGYPSWKRALQRYVAAREARLDLLPVRVLKRDIQSAMRPGNPVLWADSCYVLNALVASRAG